MNVLLALQKDSSTKRNYMNKIPFGPFRFVWLDFFGIKNSLVYRLFESRERLYYSFVLKKKDS